MPDVFSSNGEGYRLIFFKSEWFLQWRPARGLTNPVGNRLPYDGIEDVFRLALEPEVGVLGLAKKEFDPMLEFDPALSGDGELGLEDLVVDTEGGASLEEDTEADGGFNPDLGIPPKVRPIPG